MAHLGKKPLDLKQFVLWTLRRASYRWPPRSRAFANARRNLAEFKRKPGIDPKKVSARVRIFFECVECGRIFPRREVSADHRSPVVDPRRGWVSWDEFIPRLFCSEDGFDILCNEDHDAKTARERDVRTKYRRKRES